LFEIIISLLSWLL